MAFFTYPPNEATSPLFTQISVSADTSGASIFGPESVQSAITSFSLSKPADVALLAARTVGIRAKITGDTPQVTGATIALRCETRRSSLSASVTDTERFTSINVGKAVVDFTAASIPATYTSSNTHRGIQIDPTFGSNLTGNTLAISNIVGIEFLTDSQANTGRKTNILFNALSGGTSGNAQIADNTAYSGNWFINQSGTNPNRFGGSVGIATNLAGNEVLRIARPSTITDATGYGIFSDPSWTSSQSTETFAIAAQNRSDATFNAARATAIYIPAGNFAVGSAVTRVMGLQIQDQTKGSTGNASICDNTSFTGNWFINSTSTNKSSLTGALATVRFDVASAATITALDSTRSFVKLTGSTITALQGITAGVDGQRLTLVNLTGANLTVAHENAGATAANRITTMTGADVVTTANGAAEFIYDTGSSRWICLYVTA